MTDAKKLTAKREAFARAVVETGDLTGSYLSVYSANNSRSTARKQAAHLARIPEVAARIAELRERAADDSVMTRREALQRLTAIGRVNVADLLEFSEHEVGVDDQGNPIMQAAWRIKPGATPAQLSAIKEVTAGRDGLQIKLHSSVDAIVRISRLQAWDKPAQRHDDESELVRLQAEKLRRELDPPKAAEAIPASEYTLSPDEPGPSDPVL